ncbi:MAG: signal transduction histidine kinase [Phenylobacterium sp.]|jgi:signal transduction histidine kinase
MSSLKTQLTISHSKPSIFTLVGLISAVCFVGLMYLWVKPLLETRIHNALEVNRLRLAVAQTQSLIQTTILLNDAASAKNRRQLYQEVIHPISTFLLGIYDYRDEPNRNSVKQLSHALTQLEDAQWWIEDFSHHAQAQQIVNTKKVVANINRSIEDLMFAYGVNHEYDPAQLLILKNNVALTHSLLEQARETLFDQNKREKAINDYQYAMQATAALFNKLGQRFNHSNEPDFLLRRLHQQFAQYQQFGQQLMNTTQPAPEQYALNNKHTQALMLEIGEHLMSIADTENNKLTSTSKRLEDDLWMFFIAGLVFILVSQFCTLKIAAIAAKYYVKRLHSITDAASSIKDNREHLLTVDGTDEITELMLKFNEMKLAIKQREQSLIAQRHDIAQLTQIVTHDMKPPLINIKGHAKLIAEIVLPSQQHQPQVDEQTIGDSIGYIDKSIVRMDDLIKTVLNYAKASDREFDYQPVDLPNVMQQILDINNNRLKNATVTLDTPLPTILADEFSLKFVLSTLIDNAIHYQDPSRALMINIQYKMDGLHHRLSIEDNGKGINAQQAAKLFSLSGEISAAGSYGIGLCAVRTILQHVGGQIWHQSKNEGVIFVFQLPMSPTTFDINANNHDLITHIF